MSHSKLRIAFIGSIFIALFGWYSFFSYKSPSQADYTTVIGTLKSAREEASASGKSFSLELYINERNIRFRVPIELYERIFRKNEFFQKVKPGATLYLEVKKELLQSPFRPPADSIPTVFVNGLRDETTQYLTLKEHFQWMEKNHRYSLLFGGLFSLSSFIMGWVLLIRRTKRV